MISFPAGSESTHKFGAPYSDNNSERYGLITICLQPLENLPASDPVRQAVGSQPDGVMAHINPSSLPPSGPPDDIAISSAMERAEGVVNEMVNPGGLSVLGNATDAIGMATASESFSIVLQSVEKLVHAVDLLSEVSLTRISIHFHCRLIGANSDFVRFIHTPKSLGVCCRPSLRSVYSFSFRDLVVFMHRFFRL